MKLVHLETGATRIANGAASLLDLIVTNKEVCFRDTSLCPFSGSDHQIVATHLVLRGIKAKRPHKFVKCRNYRNLDEETVARAMDVGDIWEDVLEDLDDCVDCFSLVLVGYIDLICPSKWLRVRSPWCQTPEYRNIRKQRNAAHRQAIKLNDTASWDRYRKIRNKATSTLRACKLKYILDLARNLKDQSVKFWKRTSYLSGKERSSAGSSITGTAEEFNSHFRFHIRPSQICHLVTSLLLHI